MTELNISEKTAATWIQIRSELKTKLQSQQYISFVEPLELFDDSEMTLKFRCPSNFIREWTSAHYSKLIRQRFEEITTEPFALELTVPAVSRAPSVVQSLPVIKKSKIRNELSQQSRLNPKFTFETLVPGDSNQFALAAGLSVSNSPGETYNPLFIYGSVGLGKTHLMSAIGSRIAEKFPGTVVHFTTFENFTNQMIEAIFSKRMNQFREKYRRGCDVLLIDDIQFMTGKEKTQEEFFHTFNHLYESKKQIVVTSDRNPDEIPGLHDRLRSRFKMGLDVYLQSPDIETRIAILKSEASSSGIVLEDTVASYIATNARNDIRELKGCLYRAIAYSSIAKKPLDLRIAEEALFGFRFKDRAPSQTTESVDNQSAARSRRNAWERQIKMFLLKKKTKMSLQQISKAFGCKNHTTALYAINKIQTMIEADPNIGAEVSQIEKSFDVRAFDVG